MLLLLFFFYVFPFFFRPLIAGYNTVKFFIHANKGTVTRAKKRTTCFATLLQNELNSDAARFTTDNFFLPLLRTYKNVNQKRYFHRIIFCFREKGPLETLRWHGKAIGLISKTTTPSKLYTRITLFCNFFAVLYTTTARNFTVSILACAQSLP